MKNLFRAIFTMAAVVAVCVMGFWSCTKDEKYLLEFNLPGQIVTEFGKTIEVPFTSSNITSISVSTSPLGWKVDNVDIMNKIITITSPASFASEGKHIAENGELVLIGYTAAGTSVTASSYLSLLNRQIDLSDQYSNSYILTQEDTRYVIDLTHVGESDTRIKPASASVLWQSGVGLVNFSSYDSETGKFTFYVGHEDVTDEEGEVVGARIADGNAVVAAYDESGNVIWSWHLWLTGSDPAQNAITTSEGTFMDRNLGAYHNGDGSKKMTDIYRSIGLYYQWGRKDPFVRPYDYKFSSNSDQLVYSARGANIVFDYVGADSDEAGIGTYEYAVAHPMSYVLGSADNGYDWIYSSHDNSLWSSSKKSVNDPCPKGWRVPDGGVFEAFDIAEEEDLAAMVDVRDMNGWHIVDKATGVRMFLPGAGRRSFENGVLTNVNNYGYEHNPMPWTGYYWTAGAGSESATSLFFDLNTTRAVNNRYEPTKQMYRANGMQVRCVRE